MFILVITGKPDPVVNCSISNQTQSSFLVSCLPGRDENGILGISLRMLILGIFIVKTKTIVNLE